MELFFTEGVCPSTISFDLVDGKVYNIKFDRGCNGNLSLISKLFEGKTAEEIIALTEGNICGKKGTSCGDQLAKALKEALNG
jgi:uncharacterized protein (TIGR03905 family)